MDERANARGRTLLSLCGWWNLAFAVLHVAIIAMDGPGYRYFGAGEQMARAAEAGDPKPAMITAVLTLLFVLIGLCLLSAAGQIRTLPGVRWAALAIGILYFLRGTLVAPQAWWAWQYPQQVPLRFVFFSAVSLAVGVATVYGTMLRWRKLHSAN
jgi:hypothetical protein